MVYKYAYLQVVLELVDDGSGGAEVAELGLDLGELLEGALGFQVVLERGNNVGAAGGLGLKLALDLGLVGQRRRRQAEAGRPPVVRPRFPALAKRG